MLLAEVGIGTDANATGIDISEYGICILVRYRSIPVPDCAPLPVPDWFWHRHYF
jgi:hypothetical protein